MIALILLLACSTICSQVQIVTLNNNDTSLCIAARLAAGYGVEYIKQDRDDMHCKRSQRIADHDNTTPKRAIVIGASIGMGRELSKLLAADGYIVGMAARRIELLQEIQQSIPTQTHIMQMDASNTEESIAKLNTMIADMGGLDLLVIAVTGYYDCDFDDNNWERSLPVLAVDVVGFFALARTGLNFFEQQGYGHLVGFSSMDGVRGTAGAPAYSASKAFCSRYLEAEFNKYKQRNIPIYVTDICPGWVNSKNDIDFTQMPNAYWVESLDDATREIFEAIKNKDQIAYITKRWAKVAALLSQIPSDLYNALSARPGGGF
jgi:short-subunit dehydrogenase